LDSNGLSLDEILEATRQGKSWDELSAWIPFQKMLDGYDRAEATRDEALALVQGRQNVLLNILKRVQNAPCPETHWSLKKDRPRTHVTIYTSGVLVAVASNTHGQWGLERVFTDSI
jgi:hypothetical protein